MINGLYLKINGLYFNNWDHGPFFPELKEYKNGHGQKIGQNRQNGYNGQWWWKICVKHQFGH